MPINCDLILRWSATPNHLLPVPSPSGLGRDAALVETRANEGELADVLIPDPRGRLTPSQMVARKVLALLGTAQPGDYSEPFAGHADLVGRARDAKPLCYEHAAKN